MASRDASPEHDQEDRRQPGRSAKTWRDKARSRVLTAALSLLFTGLVLILPPIVNNQLAGDEHLLEKPVIAVIAAAVIAAIAAWWKRFVIAVAVVSLAVSSVQLINDFGTTAASRQAEAAARSWTNLPVARAYRGIVPVNTPDTFGYATVEWSGSDITLKLRSKTGTTQQGIYQKPPKGSKGFYFAATVVNPAGGNAVVCPLLFGITNIRNYFTFRVQDTPAGAPEAVAYQIIQNSGKFTSGFHGLLLGQDTDMPYYDTWNIIEPAAASQTRLAILFQGNYGQFFVDGRQVFARVVDDLPNYTAAVGVTVLANNLQDAANCTFKDVEFRAEPGSRA